jgi:hypothetical protein
VLTKDILYGMNILSLTRFVVMGLTLRARSEISESTFERVKHGFTTQSSYHILWW